MVNKITTPPTTSELIGKVNEIIDDKQDTLLSGTNIKTINNQSILGSGNIDIQGGGSSYTAGDGIDITNDVISVTSPTLTNTATGSNALTISGTASIVAQGVNIGYNSSVTSEGDVSLGYGATSNGHDEKSTAIGHNSKATGAKSVALGGSATALANGSIAIGRGSFVTSSSNYGIAIGSLVKCSAYGGIQLGGYSSSVNNTEDGSFHVALTSSGTTFTNYKLLGSDGKIPNDRLNLDNTPTSTSTNGITSGAVYTALDDKQDVISDLATIRSGAALGATAIQPSDLATVATSGSYNDLLNKPTIPAAQVNADWNATSGAAQILNKPTIPTVPTKVSAFTNDAGYITSSALSGYATENYVDTGLATKQATLVSGTNIKTINNTSILGSGNIDIQGGGSSYTAGTGIDITNDVISVEGVKDQRNTTTTIKTWTGTLAQYNAIATKDNNTLYNITDDNTAVAYQAYTKSEVDNLIYAIYPVGSIYIGTQSTCPLATLISGSTWVKVSEGRVLQGSDSSHGAGTTIEAGLPNITGNFGSGCLMNWQNSTTGGALYRGSSGGGQNAGGTNGGTDGSINLDASRSNSIYGSSSTVQPPAYVVNIWKRTA